MPRGYINNIPPQVTQQYIGPYRQYRINIMPQLKSKSIIVFEQYNKIYEQFAVNTRLYCVQTIYKL